MPIDVVLAGLFVFFTTSLGAFLALIFKKFPEVGLDTSLAFSGGIMLVASFTSLILPSIDNGNVYISMFGIVLGFFVIYLIGKLIPHEEKFLKYNSSNEYKGKVRNIILLALAIIIHNLPEGLAVGVSMVNDVNKGWATAIAIGIQDIPEGLAVALPLIFLSNRVLLPLSIGVLSGFSEFVFAVIGGVSFSIMHFLLPLGLAFAGGAMIYVTVKEVFPQVYSSGKNEGYITIGFLIGVLVMLFLDTALG
ncbi:MAG: ZIP family metal transporter [Hydrogenothermus sp.]|nr:MAG: ZIP family metal transporter [Hydrogenothermus sp.]